MKILQLVDTLSYGGRERVLVELANELAERGHAVQVCVTRRVTDMCAELDRRIEWRALHRRATFDPGPLLALARWIRGSGVELVQAHGYRTFALAAFLRALGLLRLPVIYHEHHGAAAQRSAPLWLRRWGRRHVARYVAVHADQLAWAERAGIAPARTRVLPNAIDLTRFDRAARKLDLRAELGIASGDSLAITVSTIRPEKGIDLLIEALGAAEGLPPTTVVVVGEPVDRRFAERCREQARALPPGRRIVWAGARRDVPALLAAADFALMPSRVESGPLASIEALAAGLALVSFDVGSVAAQAKEAGVPGFVPAADVDPFAAELRTLALASPELRARRGALGRRWVRGNHSLARTVDRWKRQ